MFDTEITTQVLSIVAGTLGSEDLTGIAVGLLIRAGKIDPWVGVLACFGGIYLGDLGLWLMGRVVGRQMLGWSWVRRRVTIRQVEEFGQWFDRRGWMAVFAARFLPATRLPLYVAAGVCGRNGRRFVLWTLVAALVWTPLLVLGVALAGDAFARSIELLALPSWLAMVLTGLGLFAGLRVITPLTSSLGRARLEAKLSRFWCWEFWPSWLFYLPLIPWLAWLALRYRSLTVWTAANPGIPQGGVLGESKFAILSQLPGEWVVPSRLLTSVADLDRLPDKWPIILKPDVSQRGAGVKRINDRAEAETYLKASPGPVIAQPFHPGPFEAGIFYYRLPGASVGHIFSLTDKVFPLLVGDGLSTLEQLVWRHPRYRMQAATFLARHAPLRSHVLATGETLPLALAGNHCQGTLFRDGETLITRELEQRIDAIAQRFEGFYFGRFDVRYTDPAAFGAGDDLAIVELNGVTSESTNIYDPTRTLRSAYRILFRQWELLFQIGNANRQRGIQVCGVRELLRVVWDHCQSPRPCSLSD